MLHETTPTADILFLDRNQDDMLKRTKIAPVFYKQIVFGGVFMHQETSKVQDGENATSIEVQRGIHHA
jgi:hypothetical protein